MRDDGPPGFGDGVSGTVIGGCTYQRDGYRGTGPPRTNGSVRVSGPVRDDAIVFILYAVLAGILIGLVTGGSIARLGDLQFRWAPLIVLGLVVQLLLFSSPVGDALGALAPPIYVLSNLAVIVAVWRNTSIPGMWLVVIGGASNLVAIVANGGYMPVSQAALDAMGRVIQL